MDTQDIKKDDALPGLPTMINIQVTGLLALSVAVAITSVAPTPTLLAVTIRAVLST